MSETCLKIKNADLGYDGKPILQNLNLDIPKNQFSVLIGANGSGKSTILKALCGQLIPSKGEVELFGKNLNSFNRKDIAKNISILSQQPEAPENIDVYQLIKQGRYPHKSLFGGWRETDERACMKAMQMTEVEDFKHRPLNSLSGGQRQRVWVALALAQETEIVLLDEPTTFLDLAHQVDVLDLIKSLVKEYGKTVIAILHDVNHCQHYGQHVVLLKEGKVIVSGAPDKIMTAEYLEETFSVSIAKLTDKKTGLSYFTARSSLS